MFSLGPNDSPLANNASDMKNQNFGGNRQNTKGEQQKTQDYTKPVGGSSNIEENPVEDVTKDIDRMTDSTARKREFSRRAETNDHGDHNKGRFSELSSDNVPPSDTSPVITPDGSYRGPKVTNDYQESPYDDQVIVTTPIVLATFEFEVKTTSENETFTLPLEATGTYDFIADWGDNSESHITEYDQEEATHTFVSIGTYDVKIQGVIEGWKFADSSSAPKVHKIKSWGDLTLLPDSGSTFEGSTNMTWVDEAAVGLDTAKVKNMNKMFKGNSSFNPSSANFDTSSVETMDSMFKGATAFNKDISNWDVSSVTDMGSMFDGATSFDQDLSNWDVSSVTDMGSMFNGVTLSVTNYDALILSWSDQVTAGSYAFDGGDSIYTLGGEVETAKGVWEDKGWTVVDGIPPSGYFAKSVILDIADSWGDASFISIRSVDFYYEGTKISNIETTNFSAIASTYESSWTYPAFAFDTSTSKTGDSEYNFTEWTTNWNATNARLVCTFNVGTYFDEIRINNSHHSGANTNRGAKNVVISYTSLEGTPSQYYGRAVTGSVQIYDGIFAQHAASDSEDEEILVLNTPEALPTVWSSFDKDADWTVTSEGRVVSKISSGGTSARSKGEKFTGKWYAEIVATNMSTTAYVGFATIEAALNAGPGAHTYVLQDGGYWKNQTSSEPDNYGPFVDGSVIGIAVDRDTDKAWVAIDGVWQGAGSPNPATGTDPSPTTMGVGDGVLLYVNGWASTNVYTINSTAEQCTYTAPTGFAYWTDKNE